jgi:hypothetical protein
MPHCDKDVDGADLLKVTFSRGRGGLEVGDVAGAGLERQPCAFIAASHSAALLPANAW